MVFFVIQGDHLYSKFVTKILDVSHWSFVELEVFWIGKENPKIVSHVCDLTA